MHSIQERTGKNDTETTKSTHYIVGLFFVCTLFFTTTFSHAGTLADSGRKQISSKTINSDGQSANALIKALYDCISFSAGQRPDLERYRYLFLPGAPFIKIVSGKAQRMDLELFISSFNRRIDSGEFNAFHEFEIARKSLRYGGMMQVFSTYKKSFTPGDSTTYTRGINSMTLVYDGQRWWISAALWQDEDEKHPIPLDYLNQQNK